MKTIYHVEFGNERYYYNESFEVDVVARSISEAEAKAIKICERKGECEPKYTRYTRKVEILTEVE